ncbi:FAD-dependent monooxygenase [Actinocatenispora rupis]|uniref:FAD-dependent oxidoreductase n=1 Tax=Actinocatenispora rupis TaxID=519421 RepID=A0A8J3NBB4_9ACTN|nr:FAD-dependent monooxygenase [Actinocatenispora rupis]GID12891.1 FAD-dependent oxidoreductase [Actinocatenispora rupis]
MSDSRPVPATTDVLVVGAGPTGLLLAGDLAAAGVAVTVAERRPDTVSNLSRAFTVHARTLEQLDARGLADELVAAGGTIGDLQLFLAADLDLTTLPSRFPYLLTVPQYEVERVLRARAERAGATIVHDAGLTALRQDATGVTAKIGVATVRARYVVGADGHRSAVRQLLGLPFPGDTAVRSIMLADVRMTTPPTGDVLLAKGAGKALALVASFGDGWYRVMGMDKGNDLPTSAPVTLDQIRDVLLRTHGTDYGMHDPRWLSRFGSDERQSPEYRVGRVFLAGDAAHVHTPAGGQGMNTGLQDAANLSWKLAAAVHGTAPAGLLDTYQAERWPVGRSVLRSSGTMMRLAVAATPVRRAVRAAAAGLVGRIGPVNRRVRDQITGIGIHYPAPRGTHRLTGRRAPDLPLAGTRLYEALRARTFVLVTPADVSPAPVDGVRVAHWADGRRDTLLVRPDGYVAYASDGTDGADPGLAAALARWVGRPAATPVA